MQHEGGGERGREGGRRRERGRGGGGGKHIEREYLVIFKRSKLQALRERERKRREGEKRERERSVTKCSITGGLGRRPRQDSPSPYTELHLSFAKYYR